MRPPAPRLLVLALLAGGPLACAPEAPTGQPPDSAADTGPVEVPWSAGLPASAEAWQPVGGLQPRRTIVHLHSAWSHDACDGEPLIDGAPDAACVSDLRQALCTVRVDAAFLTDHPAHAADQPWEALFHAQPEDEWLTDSTGQPVGLAIACGDGHTVRWYAGIEDAIMPLGLRAHAGSSAEEAHAAYDAATPEGVEAAAAAGGSVFVAHTEEKAVADLRAMLDAGLTGFEIFNLHAAFDPDIRSEHLGLDALGWLSEIGPMTSPEGTAEPDLFVLAVLLEQAPSLAAWDTLLAEGPVVGVAGTDAHQNVLPTLLRDGERGDSYRRMLRWFSNVVLVDGDAPGAEQEALAAGRSWVVFEILGTPERLEATLVDAAGTEWPVGSNLPASALPATLHLSCPALHASSPRSGDYPEVITTVLRDGEVWAEGCGEHVVSEVGAYRVLVDILPHHLAGFLGDDPDPWLRRYPWLVSNPVRIGLPD